MYYRRTKRYTFSNPVGALAAQAGGANAGHAAAPLNECFAETARPWIWVLAVSIAVVLAIGAVQIVQQMSSPKVERYRWATGAPYTVAFKPCPYCSGVMDSAGRCNKSGCPIYSPEFGSGNGAPAGSAVALVQTQSISVRELGVDVVPCRQGRGAVVEAVYPGSASQTAGLLPGDVVSRFNGRAVRNPAQLQRIARLAMPGSSVAIEWIRADGTTGASQIYIAA